MAYLGDGSTGRLYGTTELEIGPTDVVAIHGLVSFPSVPTTSQAFNKYIFGKRTIGVSEYWNVRVNMWDSDIANGVSATFNTFADGDTSHYGGVMEEPAHAESLISSGSIMAIGCVWDLASQATISRYCNGVGRTIASGFTITSVPDAGVVLSFLSAMGTQGVQVAAAKIQQWAVWINPTWNLDTGFAMLGGRANGNLGIPNGIYANPRLGYFGHIRTTRKRYFSLSRSSGLLEGENSDHLTLEGGVSVVDDFRGVQYMPTHTVLGTSNRTAGTSTTDTVTAANVTAGMALFITFTSSRAAGAIPDEAVPTTDGEAITWTVVESDYFDTGSIKIRTTMWKGVATQADASMVITFTSANATTIGIATAVGVTDANTSDLTEDSVYAEDQDAGVNDAVSATLAADAITCSTLGVLTWTDDAANNTITSWGSGLAALGSVIVGTAPGINVVLFEGSAMIEAIAATITSTSSTDIKWSVIAVHINAAPPVTGAGIGRQTIYVRRKKGRTTTVRIG